MSAISIAPGLDIAPAGEDAELRRGLRNALRLVAALVAAVLFAGLVLQIDGAVIATGRVSAESRIQTLSHPFGGVLDEVLVAEGDHVRRGQVLMRLDTKVATSNAAATRLTRIQLLARKARLEAERDGSSAITFPSELRASNTPDRRAAMASEEAQFRLGQSERQSSISLLGERIRQTEQQVVSYQAQIEAARQELALIGGELDGLRDLRARGLVTVNRLNAAERTAVELQAKASSLEANIAAARAQNAEIRQQILATDKSRKLAAGDELAQVEAQLNDQTSRMASADDALARGEIIAPRAGVVSRIAFRTPGSGIPPATPLMEILPDEAGTFIEAEVDPAAIDNIRIGQEARVRFTSIDSAVTPVALGKVTFVAATPTRDPQSGRHFFRVHVRIDRSNEAGAANFRAGMPAEVFLQTGRRSILSYLFKPLTDQIQHAMRS